MNSLIIVVITISALISLGHSKCTVPETNPAIILDVGDFYKPPEHCIRYSCDISGDTPLIGCGLVGIPKGRNCRAILEDNTKPYPDCCSHYVCDD